MTPHRHANANAIRVVRRLRPSPLRLAAAAALQDPSPLLLYLQATRRTSEHAGGRPATPARCPAR